MEEKLFYIVKKGVKTSIGETVSVSYFESYENAMIAIWQDIDKYKEKGYITPELKKSDTKHYDKVNEWFDISMFRRASNSKGEKITWYIQKAQFSDNTITGDIYKLLK